MAAGHYHEPEVGRLLIVLVVCLAAAGVAWRLAGPKPSGSPARGASASPSAPRKPLPRVLLIGDSITLGYAPTVATTLAGKATVVRIPENGGSSRRGLARLGRWLGAGHWDVIHFNFGLHDIKLRPKGGHEVQPAAYRRNLRALVARLEATGATLIWATTTPVPPGPLHPPRSSADVPVYNAIAARIMAQHGIVLDDLNRLVRTWPTRIQRPHSVHFTARGYAVLGRHVAAVIAAALRGGT
jgi:acyl-CoA thioesterase-1